MDAKLKAKWIKALRSGKFKQCEGNLTDGKGYCCLGVLHKIAVSKRVPARWGDNQRPKKFRFIDETLPNGRSIESQLVRMNDGHGGIKKRGFRGIATWIEKNL